MAHRLSTRKIWIILFWIAAWQLASLLIHNDIIFVGPLDVIHSFFALLPTADFWLSLARSFGRISLGFLGAFFCGILAGSLSFRFPVLKEFLEPVILLMKSVPVASFVILALIWIGSANLAVLISFLIVFPILYVNTIEGLKSADRELLEMARVFSLNLPGRIRYLYLPALMPFLSGGCKVALGMSWKSGIAAEVIGIPSHTIGEKLYMAKIYLSTADLFAWTIVIILASALFERTFLALLQGIPGYLVRIWPVRRCLRSDVRMAENARQPERFRLEIRNLAKSYGDLKLWENLDMTLFSGSVYCLMSPSGSGKTTLFRILLGLERADCGDAGLSGIPDVSGISVLSSPLTVSDPPSPARSVSRITAVFQEDRLCEALTPVDNVIITAGAGWNRARITAELARILPEESLSRPVSTLSGGMKRRVAIARAMLAPGRIILMDEPFTGLDEETRQTVITFIKEKAPGRLLLIATHQEADVEALDGILLRPFM